MYQKEVVVVVVVVVGGGGKGDEGDVGQVIRSKEGLGRRVRLEKVKGDWI